MEWENRNDHTLSLPVQEIGAQSESRRRHSPNKQKGTVAPCVLQLYTLVLALADARSLSGVRMKLGM